MITASRVFDMKWMRMIMCHVARSERKRKLACREVRREPVGVVAVNWRAQRREQLEQRIARRAQGNSDTSVADLKQHRKRAFPNPNRESHKRRTKQRRSDTKSA